jgi:hypothetical protein
MKRKLGMRVAGAVGFAIAVGVFIPGAQTVASERGGTVASGAGAYTPGVSVTRRLSPKQYESVVRDVFGETVTLGGRFEPELRRDGLLAVGAGYVSVTSTGMQQFESMSRAIASQVTDERHRDLLVPCKPAANDGPDEACARQFLSRVGRALYGRALSPEELRVQVSAANMGAKDLRDFYQGLWLSLASMLSSPDFLFRYENLVKGSEKNGVYDLDAYSKASRLSFFLWNSRPDEALLKAAEDGDLNSPRGIRRQVERMMASQRIESGQRAFFTDMLGLDDIDNMAKDSVIYPKFDAMIAQDAKEQTLRTIMNVVLKEKGDYRQVFTTPKTFLTRRLGAIYNVPVVNNAANGGEELWQEYSFQADDPRAGIVSHMSFVALHSHPGRSSPTLRGKAIREVLMCQKVPAPPGDVDLTLFNDPSAPNKTARDRLTAHVSNPVCAGCHKITDPMGLALENFDGIGSYRMTENGVEIDASGGLDRSQFNTAAGLGQALAQSPAATNCLVNRLVSYGLGRVPDRTETPWVKDLEKNFADSGYSLFNLMKRIATDPGFYKATAPKPSMKTAANTTATTLH